MKVLASWLQEYLFEKLTAQEMGARLERAGIELEQIISTKKIDINVVVGLVTKIVQHPNADKLRLAEVTVGEAVVKVVCGAPNLDIGQKVALALVGTILPDGNVITETTIRGEVSRGMICSGLELGLNDDHSGIMVLPPAYPVGITLCDIVDNDEILDLTTAANRSDLLSIIGLAREIAAMGSNQLQLPKIKGEVSSWDHGFVKNVDENLVERYMVARLKCKIQPSPEWLKKRLVGSGIRPVNSVVDITNYVMLEYGQPLHAFDTSKVTLPISVRRAVDGDELITLDGTKRKLSKEDIIITDSNGPIALAGVMGGRENEIDAETSEIILESAVFKGSSVRKTAVKHGLRTEASARFERGLPLELPPLALARAVELLIKHSQGSPVADISDSLTKKVKTTSIKLRIDRLSLLAGVKITPQLAATKLENLGFGVKVPGDKASIEVDVPWWRLDVKSEADLVEEVVRQIGYDVIPTTLPRWRAKEITFDQWWQKLWRLKSYMLGLGFFEVVTYSFVSENQLDIFGLDKAKHLKLKNPLSIEQAYLRSTLMPSLVATVGKNVHYAKQFGLFEVSKVYIAGSDHAKLPKEPMRLAVIHRGGYARAKQALDLISFQFKLDFTILAKPNPALHPTRSAEVSLGGKSVGWIGEVNPDSAASYKLSEALGYLELDLAPIFDQSAGHTYEPISRFPAITRDLAIVVPDTTTWAQVAHLIESKGLAKAKFLNDYFGPELPAGHKSLAMRINFVSMERTLTDREADDGVKQIMTMLEKALGAQERK